MQDYRESEAEVSAKSTLAFGFVKGRKNWTADSANNADPRPVSRNV